MRGVDKQAREEPSGQRLLQWGVRHSGRSCSRGLQPIEITGVNRAPEWKDGFDNARQERTLEAVGCRRWFGLERLMGYGWVFPLPRPPHGPHAASLPAPT